MVQKVLVYKRGVGSYREEASFVSSLISLLGSFLLLSITIASIGSSSTNDQSIASSWLLVTTDTYYSEYLISST